MVDSPLVTLVSAPELLENRHRPIAGHDSVLRQALATDRPVAIASGCGQCAGKAGTRPQTVGAVLSLANEIRHGAVCRRWRWAARATRQAAAQRHDKGRLQRNLLREGRREWEKH